MGSRGAHSILLRVLAAGFFSLAACLASGLVSCAVHATPSPSTWAIVIGISHYMDESLNLRYAEDDAIAVSAYLQTVCGVPRSHIALLTNEAATREAVDDALVVMRGQMSPEDTLVFYFSGHGTNSIPDTNHDEAEVDPSDKYDEALILFDAEYGSFKGLIVDDELALQIGQLGCKTALVILDSCYAGGAGRGKSAEIFDVGTKEGTPTGNFRDISVVAAGGTTPIMLMACQDDQKAQECGALGHGLFTKAILDTLEEARTAPGRLSINALAGEVQVRMENWIEADRNLEDACGFDQTPMYMNPENCDIYVTPDIELCRPHLSACAHSPSLDFGETATERSFCIYNDGDVCGSLVCSMTAIDADGKPATWVTGFTPATVDIGSSIEGSQIRVTASRAGLPTGQYSALVVVSASNGDRVEIPVTMIVDVQPKLIVTPSLLVLAPDGPSGSLRVGNATTGALHYQVIPSDKSWLKVNPMGGTCRPGGTEISITVEPSQVPCTETTRR